MVALIRPLDGVIVGTLIGLWMIGIGGERPRFRHILAFGLSLGVIGVVMLGYNSLLTGSATTFPVNAYFDTHYGPGSNDLGFGPNRGLGWAVQPTEGHSPLGGLINANLNAFSINVELLGWGVGSLLLVTLGLLAGRLKRSDYLMIAVCLATFVPYFLYWYSGGPDFGARYWYLMIIPLVVFAVRGIQALQESLAEGDAESPGRARVLVAVAVLSLITVISYLPWRAVDKYYGFWGMRPGIVELAQAHQFGKSLVLIEAEEPHPDYASAAVYNPLDWSADEPIYAWDRNPEVRARLLQAYPDRPIWIVDGTSVGTTGYRVVAGPLSAEDLARAGSAP
jgi:hypothetical protein